MRPHLAATSFSRGIDMKKVLLLVLTLFAVTAEAQTSFLTKNPCYYSGQYVKCLPPLGFDLSGTTQAYLGANGTVTAPTFAFSSDADGTGTGLYRIGANNLGFAANGIAVGNISSLGAWTIGDAAGSRIHTIQSGGDTTTIVKNDGAGTHRSFVELDYGSTAVGDIETQATAGGGAMILRSLNTNDIQLRNTAGSTIATFKNDLSTTLGGALTFPNGGTALGWYEEGTFTPAVFATGTAGTVTYSNAQGFFTRIGRRLFFTIRVAWSNWTGSPTTAMQVTGLPYTIKNSTGNIPSFAVLTDNIVLPAGGLWIGALGSTNATTIDIYAGVTASNKAVVDPATNSGSANRAIYVSGSYDI